MENNREKMLKRLVFLYYLGIKIPNFEYYDRMISTISGFFDMENHTIKEYKTEDNDTYFYYFDKNDKFLFFSYNVLGKILINTSGRFLDMRDTLSDGEHKKFDVTVISLELLNRKGIKCEILISNSTEERLKDFGFYKIVEFDNL